MSEVVLGAWLLASPLVFASTTGAGDYTWSVRICGALTIVLALISFLPRFRRAHLATLLVAGWLAAHGYFFAERPGPPAAQNELMTGMLLLLFVILPSEASRPPVPWRGRRAHRLSHH